MGKRSIGDAMKIPDSGQFIGSLIGQCLGDAIGYPVEGRSPQDCRDFMRELIEEGPGIEKRIGRAFGQYSDDSQLARELILSYIARKRFDPVDYSARIADLFSRGLVIGGGVATREAAMRLARGIPWDHAGAPSPSAGNGSAMRAGPIGMMFFDDRASLVSAARDQGFITHQDSRCSAGAVAIAGAVSLALTHARIDYMHFLEEIAGLAGMVDPAARDAYASLADWVSLEPAQALESMVNAGYAMGEIEDWQGITPFVTGSVMWSLYSFLHSPESYLDAIATAVWVGGDVDTTAAMAGAISGAYLGLGNIPQSLAENLTDQGRWGFEDLIGLASDLYEIKVQLEISEPYP
jgi:ADP-ribosylglycohydrolase